MSIGSYVDLLRYLVCRDDSSSSRESTLISVKRENSLVFELDFWVVGTRLSMRVYWSKVSCLLL